jgi:2-methylisocitrate lyase-like PEP mutase family enzyme
MAASTTASKGKQLRDLIYAPKILVAPGVYDGYSVRLLEFLEVLEKRFTA